MFYLFICLFYDSFFLTIYRILSRFMYNILNSISFVNLYTELATVISLAVVVVFFLFF